jgi:hypothetical protein
MSDPFDFDILNQTPIPDNFVELPQNAEDVRPPLLSEGAIQAAVPSEQVCPNVADIIFAEFPELTEVLDIIKQAGALVDPLIALKARLLEPPDPEASENEIKSLLTTAGEKITQTAERVAQEVKDQAAEIAATAWDAWYATANSITRTTQAIEEGVINIENDIQNIDVITLNAIDAQFPGFKSAIDCLYGEDGGSVREGGVENAKEQVNTPAPSNKAEAKTNVAEISPEPTEEEKTQKGITSRIPPTALDQLQSGFARDGNEYPHIFVDPDDRNTAYAVFVNVTKLVRIYDISGSSPVESGSADFEAINKKFDQDFNELPYQRKRNPDTGESAGKPTSDLTSLGEVSYNERLDLPNVQRIIGTTNDTTQSEVVETNLNETVSFENRLDLPNVQRTLESITDQQ